MLPGLCCIFVCNKEPVSNQDVKRLFNRIVTVRGQGSPVQCCNSSPSVSEVCWPKQTRDGWSLLHGDGAREALGFHCAGSTHTTTCLGVLTPMQTSAHQPVPLDFMPLPPHSSATSPRPLPLVGFWTTAASRKSMRSICPPPACTVQGDTEQLGRKAQKVSQAHGHGCVRVPALMCSAVPDAHCRWACL